MVGDPVWSKISHEFEVSLTWPGFKLDALRLLS